MQIYTMKYVFCIFGAILLIVLAIEAVDVVTQIPPEVATRIPAAAKLLNKTRRIINGVEVTENRPYMVHLKLPQHNEKAQKYRKWLCGGVIVHEEYILTSAACIEDVEHFYVVSGTYKYSDEDDRYNNPCIKNGAKKAIWKCVPKNYVFDGHESDNIRWMNNDIAVVKIEDGFDFTRRVRGCDFVPKPVCYNNQSQTLENPGTIVSVAGWGTREKYNDWVNRRADNNQQTLLETPVEIISKSKCKHRWGSRYYNIIENYMICTKDIGQMMSEICNEKYVECEDINYYDDEEERRRSQPVIKTDRVPINMVMHSALHNETYYTNGSRRFVQMPNHGGGFCENDHGGPLIYGSGINSVVIGIISACLVKERTNKCYGPFLYTSVYKNRQFISCSIFKDVEPKCRRQFRSGITHQEKVLSWKNHPDGPAKFEMPPKKMELAPPVTPKKAATPKEPAVNEPVAPVAAFAAQEVPIVADEIVTEKPLTIKVVSDKIYSNSGFVMRAVNTTQLIKVNGTG